MNSPWNHAFKQLMKRPSFLIVFLVLLTGAIGLNAATTAFKLFFRKEALPLRAKEGLEALPEHLGKWVCVPEVHTMDADTAHELGTEMYVFRDYVNTGALGGDGKPVATPEEVLALKGLSPADRAHELNKIRVKNNNAVLSLAITYYTGKVDTVPHVPERCYVADGFLPTTHLTLKWHLGDYAPGDAREVPVRFIDFEDQTTRGQQNRCVTYFFHANGKYEEDPNQVRLRLQHLTEKYAYFAKIEVMTLLPPRPGALEGDPLKEGDRKAASLAMQQFLTTSLPEVEKLLPDPKVFNQ
jgi:hypothetical protein